MNDENPILRYFRIVRPQLWEESELKRVSFVLHHALVHSVTPTWDELTDALAELVPEKREYWLRIQATHNQHFLEAMTAMFECANEESNDAHE